MSHPAPLDPTTHASPEASPAHQPTSVAGPPASAGDGDSEVIDDGQEEVFAYSAVERGLVEDPKALGPEDLARVPISLPRTSGD